MHGYSQDEIYGTWYPTGFHGHFRSKSRQDFTIPYRQRAKPPPPVKFLNRATARSNDHLFSRHDNRNVHSSTMGDLEMHFSHGLGKRKSVTGASQRYKDTSSLLRWSEEPRFSPVSSYRADFLSQSLPQTKIVNVSEPVHSRSHLALRRRQIRADPKALPIRTAPLLAWNVPDKSTYEKPCVGSERTRNSVFETMSRENSGKLCRQSRTCDQVAYGNNPNDSNLSHVIETVTKLDL